MKVVTIMIMIASSTKITSNVMHAVKSMCLPFWFSVRKSETETYNHLICLTKLPFVPDIETAINQNGFRTRENTIINQAKFA